MNSTTGVSSFLSAELKMSRRTMHDIQRIIDHEDFYHYFCNNVDPLELLPHLRLRPAHEVLVRNLSKIRPDDANLEIMQRLKCEVDWKERLLRALEKADLLETIRKHLYGNRKSKQPPRKRRVTMDTPLKEVQPLFSCLESLDTESRWRGLAEYADLTLDDVEKIEARASAKRKMCSEQLIHFLIETKGNQITLGWLLKGLKQKGQLNVFTDICKQLDMEVLLEDVVDSPENICPRGDQWNGSDSSRGDTCDPDLQKLIQALWDCLVVPPVTPREDHLTWAMEEEGSHNGPGFDVVGRDPPSPPPSAGKSGIVPGKDSKPRPTAGTNSALSTGLLQEGSGGVTEQGATAANTSPGGEARRRGRPEEGKTGPKDQPHTGMENGPCPNTDMINAEERLTSKNFHPIHHGGEAPNQATATGAVESNIEMESRFKPDSMDIEEPYEVLLREGRPDQDGREQAMAAWEPEMRHTSQPNGEQERVNVISHQSSAYPSLMYSGQNVASEEGGSGDGTLDSGLSSSRSIDLRQQHRPQQPQRSESDDSSAVNPLEGIQFGSAFGRVSAGVAAGADAPFAYVDLSQQHVSNGNADGDMRMLHHQPPQFVSPLLANPSTNVEMPGSSAMPTPSSSSDVTVMLSSGPAPCPLLQRSGGGGVSSDSCSPAGLSSNSTSSVSSNDDSLAVSAMRNSPSSPLGRPEFGGRPNVPASLPSDPSSSPDCSSPEDVSREMPALSENGFQTAQALSVSSPTATIRSDYANESEVFHSAAASLDGDSARDANSASAGSSMNGSEEEPLLRSLTHSISSTLQSLFNSG